MSPSASRPRGSFWRDNVEAMTMAIVMALVLKYFLIEAYKIPTGSMQPTLMGLDLYDERGNSQGVYDRILVDKLSYRFRDPERFEVAVFRYPLDRSKNFVKRVVGMPGESLRIMYGDLWTRQDESEPWTIIRRSRGVQDDMLRALDRFETDESNWIVVEGGEDWILDERNITARGDGLVRWDKQGGPVVDEYNDGYPDALRDRVYKGVNHHNVGDLRLTCDVRALPGCTSVWVELHESTRTYRLRLPGPAAPEGATATIEVENARPRYGELEGMSATGDTFRLPAGRSVRLLAQNMDDLLELEVDGEVLCSLEIPLEHDARAAVLLGAEGEGADFEDLMPWRDVYYTTDSAKVSELTIPEGNYFMLGDNTQDSSDSREWTFVEYEVRLEDGTTETVRGNSRRGTILEGRNPYTVQSTATTWIRDEWGERRRFPFTALSEPDYIESPLVPREMIQGRALAVFWPILPWRGITRLKWIR